MDKEVLTTDSLSWVNKWLSEPRWASYRAVARDELFALSLYEWNLRLAGALLHDIAQVEVALRNAYQQVFSQMWDEVNQGDWLTDEDSPVRSPLIIQRQNRSIDVNARNRQAIDQAISRLGEREVTTDRVIAELSFGFWRHLTDAAHEKRLWITYLFRAFPAKTNRKAVEADLRLLNEIRNRAAHHEPFIFQQRREEAQDCLEAVLRLSGLIIPELRQHVREHSKVKLLLDEFPQIIG